MNFDNFIPALQVRSRKWKRGRISARTNGTGTAWQRNSKAECHRGGHTATITCYVVLGFVLSDFIISARKSWLALRHDH